MICLISKWGEFSLSQTLLKMKHKIKLLQILKLLLLQHTSPIQLSSYEKLDCILAFTLLLIHSIKKVFE